MIYFIIGVFELFFNESVEVVGCSKKQKPLKLINSNCFVSSI